MEFPHGDLRFRYQGLVLYFDNASWQERLPEIHQPLIAGIEGRDIPKIVSVVVTPMGEVLAVDGQAGIQGIPAAMDDGGLWEQQGDEPHVHEIQRVLFQYIGRIALYPRELPAEVAGDELQFLAVQCAKAFWVGEWFKRGDALDEVVQKFRFTYALDLRVVGQQPFNQGGAAAQHA